MERIAVYGADGFGREVVPMIRHSIGPGLDLVFADDKIGLRGTTVNGYRVLSFEQALAEGFTFSIAIADGAIRRKIAERISQAGGKIRSIRAAGTVVFDEIIIGEGELICSHVTITSNVVIGKHFHANIYSYVAHDCVIGDFVTFAPRVSCNGRVEIGDGAYVGTGAVIKQGTPGKPLRIGAGAVIGMGAVVTKDVPAGATVVGNPARILEKKT